jgi:hypothetical protein
MRTSEPPRKSSSLTRIRAAETFLHLHTFMGDESVQTIETGLECGRWFPRKRRNTVRIPQLCTCHSNFQFSQQLLTAFESRFEYLDWLNTHKRRQRPKPFCRTNQRRRFPRRLSRCSLFVMVLHQQSISQFSLQHRPHLGPDLIIQIDSAPLITG